MSSDEDKSMPLIPRLVVLVSTYVLAISLTMLIAMTNPNIGGMRRGPFRPEDF